LRRDELDQDVSIDYLFINKMVINLDVLSVRWNTGLEARAKAFMLSHHNIGADMRGMQSSLKSICSQNNSVVASTIEWYVASIIDRETTACFLALQETKQLLRYTPNLEVEHRSSGRKPKLSHRKLAMEDYQKYTEDHDQWFSDIVELT
jgi:hypothetical protein